MFIRVASEMDGKLTIREYVGGWDGIFGLEERLDLFFGNVDLEYSRPPGKSEYLYFSEMVCRTSSS